MTDFIVSTKPHIRFALAPDLREVTARAQLTADGAYSLALAGGHTSGVYAAFVYHTTFVDEMARLGSPMPCGCLYCETAGAK